MSGIDELLFQKMCDNKTIVIEITDFIVLVSLESAAIIHRGLTNYNALQ